MRLSKPSRLALCAVLLGALAAGSASAQPADKDERYNLKPLIPPVFQLPPNAQVKPGDLGRTQLPTDPTAPTTATQPQSAPAPGLRITIPTR